MNHNRFAVVTGASRGIGAAIALKLANNGFDIAIFGRDDKKLAEIKADCENAGAKVISFIGAVEDKNFVDASIENIIKEFGKIDALINNAGSAVFKKLIESSLEEFKSQINANIIGVYNFCKAVLPDMIKKKNGAIINISSLAGKNPFVGGTMYSATKHALMGFTKSLMLEAREFDVKIAAICPGSVNTELIADGPDKSIKAEKILKPSDVAETVLWILNSPSNALISEIEIRPLNPK